MKTPNKPAAEMSSYELAQYIDHAVLSPSMPADEIRANIDKGIELHCRSVCVNPAFLEYAAEKAKGTDTMAIAVCDFPFGQGTTAARVAACEDYIARGAQEIDIVANYDAVISGDCEACVADLKEVAAACHAHGVPLKVIIETDALTKEQVRAATDCVARAGADFVKSSTGYYTGGEKVGATPEVVGIMLEAAKGRIKVKGSGCVRTKERLFALIDMGVDAIGAGCGSTPKLVE